MELAKRKAGGHGGDRRSEESRSSRDDLDQESPQSNWHQLLAGMFFVSSASTVSPGGANITAESTHPVY